MMHQDLLFFPSIQEIERLSALNTIIMLLGHASLLWTQANLSGVNLQQRFTGLFQYLPWIYVCYGG